MKKTISIILLFCLLLLCMTGCSPSNNNGNDQNSGQEDAEARQKLQELFELIESDAEKNSKISFSVTDQELHYELKESGLYDTSVWSDSYFMIFVKCDYEYAVDEDWYKQSAQTDRQVLNEAFYNCHKTNFLNAEDVCSDSFDYDGLSFLYSSSDGFSTDYEAFKALLDLEYVTKLSIDYYFGLPGEYRLE